MESVCFEMCFVMWLYDFQLDEIELEIKRQKEALKEDDRRQRNLARQVYASHYTWAIVYCEICR